MNSRKSKKLEVVDPSSTETEYIAMTAADAQEKKSCQYLLSQLGAKKDGLTHKDEQLRRNDNYKKSSSPRKNQTHIFQS